MAERCRNLAQKHTYVNPLSPYYRPRERTGLTLLGWYQLLGGGLGLVMVGVGVLLSQPSRPAELAIGGIGILLNGYALFAGYRLITRQQIGPSLFVQAAQILHVTLLGFTGQFLLGLAVEAGYEWAPQPGLMLDLKFVSLYQGRYKPSQIDDIRILVNVVPLFIISYLARQKQAARERVHARPESSGCAQAIAHYQF